MGESSSKKDILHLQDISRVCASALAIALTENCQCWEAHMRLLQEILKGKMSCCICRKCLGEWWESRYAAIERNFNRKNFFSN